MGVQWEQESKDKNIRPIQLPQFEVTGQQTDHLNYEKALQLVVSRTTVTVLILLGIGIAFQVRHSFSKHKTTFAQFQAADTNFRNMRLNMRLHGIKRHDSVPGLILASKPRPGFDFVVAEVSILNRGRDDVMINIYAIKLVTTDDKYYSTHLNTKTYKGRLKSKTLGTQRIRTRLPGLHGSQQPTPPRHRNEGGRRRGCIGEHLNPGQTPISTSSASRIR